MSSENEFYVWVAVVGTIIIMRLAARVLQLGSPKRLQWEDAIMVGVLVAFCIMTAGLVTVGRLGANEIPLGTPLDEIGPPSIADRVLGSKWVIITEQMFLATVWGSKACLLLLYKSITTGLELHRRLVLIISVITAFSYLLIQICFFVVWCRPFHHYWAIPATSMNCSVYTDHLILVLSANVTTDLLMMGIPLPLLIQARLSIWKKVTLCGIFSLGIFVIFCGCLSKYYSLHHPYGAQWIAWYVREAGTAVLVANIPQCWPLVRRLLNARDFLSRSGKTSANAYAYAYPNGSTFPMSNLRTERSQLRSGIDRTESQEHIRSDPLQIWEHKQFYISETSETAHAGSTSSASHSPAALAVSD
ncbi:hypothetical protein P175DRAFT_0439175 [Aspergillus ochraceoroseus IBT 24754]|uniref:Rhodopsin domain-containing protein n=2 Tax=Aspergillus ochraceoroseus TaxID=138278 RepID=A0A2T5LUF7_9EURO|nr:uncharacterized protein P175DRAFT_0439175 [Aspergillus ochraceoroseus IBT 24754]KKK17896.1 hypothetical protein AOCH_004732 [Aspergillus ochraceoroseus]PTU19921.1 hypothetical protein P175DRAFT_0439175 [Aspergillus ochraceoroseus IBT 24754]